MKLVSWNVNGIRSVFRTTFKEWMKQSDADIICLQEVKADSAELSDEYTKIDGYYAYFNSSSLKKGHSGTAVYTKMKPLKVETKLGICRFDDEGRCIKLTFANFILYNFYIPHGDRDKHDVPYKLGVYEQLLKILQSNADVCADGSRKPVILAGDFNIAHTDLDVYYAKQNEGNTMFTPEERSTLGRLIDLGHVDAFRYKYPEKKAYTWWPYTYGLRERDIGWRIDYFFVSTMLAPLIQDAFMQREVLGSDHGPHGIVLDLKVEAEEKPVHVRIDPAPTLF
ncbi:MAG: Exodeoxyribonuclease [Candidatus Taylorbacteria bacterium]|nr:Exodeoxyribonuclease [Candidatus Taylorbacteria bacterium]